LFEDLEGNFPDKVIYFLKNRSDILIALPTFNPLPFEFEHVVNFHKNSELPEISQGNKN